MNINPGERFSGSTLYLGSVGSVVCISYYIITLIWIIAEPWVVERRTLLFRQVICRLNCRILHSNHMVERPFMTRVASVINESTRRTGKLSD